MDKLSSILPSSPRVGTVDLAESHPVRPGTPTYGRPVGETASQRNDRVTLSAEAREAAFNETIAKHNPQSDVGAKIAKDTSEKFFATRKLDLHEVPHEELEQEHFDELAHEQPRVSPSTARFAPSGSENSRNSLNKYA